ncbi:MAG: histidine kinase dimerization/phosphoacceptor domain -containing protein [Fodinibius sp.]|nr:histidine kinase dimerization/phosphoacceptor domain -containing protein [Fodinibius sp.]
MPDRLLYDGQTSNKFRLLLKNISSLNRAVDLDTLLKQTLKVVRKVMQAEASSLMLFNGSSAELIISMPTGLIRREVEKQPTSKSVAGRVIEHAKPWFTNEVAKDELFITGISDDFTTENVIGVPITDDAGKVFGVLQAINRTGEQGFEEHDMPVFEALSDYTSQAIERVREVEKLQNKLHEKEIMLTEVHHRLKNNLSTITALIEMELSEVHDDVAVQLLKKTSSRINAMAGVHDLLYGTGLCKQINLKSYFERIVQKIAEILSRPSQDIEIELEAEDIQLETDLAMSCGLLLNELIVNCYKHAFNDSRQNGRITIALSRTASDYVSLRVSDNGAGIGKNFKLGESDTVGGWLIDVLLKRLDAVVDITNSDGTTFIIRFKE